MSRTAARTHGFTESVIREMTRVAAETGAINLAQGFPDFPAPDVLKEAACAAIRADVNQYAVTWGAPRLRRALAAKYARDYGMAVDEAREVTVTCGATEAMASALLAVIDPGDEVIVFEPFYENYGPDAILCGARPRWVPMDPAAELDFDRIDAAIGPRTRAIIVNTPNNPTGRVLSRAELQGLAERCLRHDLLAVTDEIYEHILYDAAHIPIATLDGMRERTITISGFSKTFSVTGWRVGTIVAPASLTAAIRKVHDFLDGRRARTAAGSMRGGAGDARTVVLRGPGWRVSRPTRRARDGASRCRLRLLRPSGRVLRAGGHHRPDGP